MLARAFHGSSEGMAVARLGDGRILDVNEALLRVLGQERAEVMGGTIVDLDVPCSTEIIPGGDEPLVLVRTTGRLTENGLRYQELRGADVRYRAMIEAVPAIIYTESPDPSTRAGSRATYVSPQALSILGYSPEELMANHELWYERMHAEDRDRVVDEERRADESGRFCAEYRLQHREGHVVWVRDQAVPITDPETNETFWQGVMLDITELKRAQEDLSEALARDRSAARRLRSLDRLKNTLLHTLSHDIRNPLAGVMGAATALLQHHDELAPDERGELLLGIHQQARKIDRMLSDLLDLDRLDRVIVEPDRAETELAELIRAVLAGCEMDGRAVELDLQPLVATVDGPKVERIVENLLSNAAKHTPPGSSLWVRLRRVDEGALVVVEDDGPGVPDRLKRVIFEPFRRGNQNQSPPDGTGIGLSLVAGFTELHGGRAWVEDRPGGGASFHVVLPDRSDPHAPLAG